MEIWKKVKGFEDAYEVSTLGRVKSIGRNVKDGFNYVKGKILKLQTTHDKYNYIILRRGKKIKSFRVHRLVAITFIENTDNKPEVNHRNGNKQDNSIANLEWISRIENVRHSFKFLGRKSSNKGKFGKLNHTSKSILQFDLNKNLIKEFGSLREAARELSLNHGLISKCAKGKIPQYGGFIWRYK